MGDLLFPSISVVIFVASYLVETACIDNAANMSPFALKALVR